MKNVLLQYNLWLNCNQRCAFCYQGSNPRRFSEEEKTKSLRRFLSILKDDDFMSSYDDVAIIGGEIFDNKFTNENERLYFECLSIIRDKMKHNKLRSFNMNTNLLYEDMSMLTKTLDFFGDLQNRLHVVTSYDVKYRFHTENSRLLFLSNLSKIDKEYPKVNKTVQSVVSSFFIDDVLNGRFDINQFEQKYHCEYNLNNVIHSDLVDRLGKDFFPKRDEYIKFLFFLKKTNLKLLQRFNVDKDDKDFIYCDPETDKIRVANSMKLKRLSCGHYETYLMYSDCDKCTLCDTRMIQGKLQ